MLTDLHPQKIYIATGYTDLRCGIDGLAGIVQGEFQLDPFGDALFLFCGRRNDRIKALYWDTNGLNAEDSCGRETTVKQDKSVQSSTNGSAPDLNWNRETSR